MAKFTVNPHYSNYAATVMALPKPVELAGLDNLVGVPVFGMQALVTKNHQEGEKVIIVPTETQISEEFAHKLNLYRDSTLNADPTQVGYLDKNRRVRAIRLRGHVSNALILPVTALSHWLSNKEIAELEEGTVFHDINGVELFTKYIVPSTIKADPTSKNSQKKFSRIDSRLFPEHIDTVNWWRNKHLIEDDEWVIVTQKLHGTSARFGNVPAKRKLTWRDKIALKFGVPVQLTEYAPAYGSRRVIKNDTADKGWYGHDVWAEWAKRLENIIPKNFIVYGEIIGWVNNEPIQKNYTYDVPKGESEFYIYRVSIVNPDGILSDLSWDAVKEFANERGLNHVPELGRMVGGEEAFQEIDTLMDTVLADEFTNAIPLSDPKSVDEGVALRVERRVPYILKAKSPKFLEHETKLLDAGVVDAESAESA